MNGTENWDRPSWFSGQLDHESYPVFLIQQTRCDLLHFIYRKRAVHIHRRLVRLMAEKVLNPLGAEAFGFQKPGDGMTKEVRIEMCEVRIGIGYPGFSANRLDNMVD